MAKKNFTGGIDSLFQASNKKVVKEKTENREQQIPSYSRTTLIVNNNTYEKIKAIAYWERKSIKDLIEEGFNKIISKYSKEQVGDIQNQYKYENQKS